MNSVEELRLWVEGRKSQKTLILSQIQDKQIQIISKKSYVDDLVKARWVITEVAQRTQNRFKDFVENLVTMAIRAVYENRTMRFLLNFRVNRNRSEAWLQVQEGDKEPYTPKDAQGGGMVDMIGMSMRPVLQSIEKPRSRNVIIADEPMKNLGHGRFLTRAGEILREISHRLGFQLILVTHEPELVQIADKAWNVTYNGVHSEVTLIKEEKETQRSKEDVQPVTRPRKLL